MPNYYKVFNQYPDLSENKISSPNRKLKAEVLRRVKALKVDWIKEVRFGDDDSHLQNLWKYIKSMPAILKNPVPTLQSQMADRIFDKDKDFFERDSVNIIELILERLQANQILYIRSSDEFKSENEIPTGCPAFLVVPNGEGYLIGESWTAHEGQKYEINESLTPKEIIEILSKNLDSDFWQQQIVIFENPRQQGTSETIRSLSGVRKELVTSK
jgi:hypothetical protein